MEYRITLEDGEKFIHMFLSSFPRFSSFFMSVIPWVSWRCLKSPRFIPYLHIGETWSFSLTGMWSKVSSTRRTMLNIFGKETDLGGKLFHKQTVYHQKSINIQQSFRLGRRITLYREVLINVNRNLQKAVYKKEGWTKSANKIRVRYKEIIIKSMR